MNDEKYLDDLSKNIFDLKDINEKRNLKTKKQEVKKSKNLFNKVTTIIIIIISFLGLLIASVFGYLSYITE